MAHLRGNLQRVKRQMSAVTRGAAITDVEHRSMLTPATAVAAARAAPRAKPNTAARNPHDAPVGTARAIPASPVRPPLLLPHAVAADACALLATPTSARSTMQDVEDDAAFWHAR